MKTLRNTLLTSVLLSFCVAANAAQKIGVVNVEGIFQQMPQAAAVQKKIADEYKDRQAEMKQMESDIKYEIDKRQREAATMSEKQIKALEAKILKMRQDYAAKAQPLQQEVQQRLAQERNKLLGLIQQSIQTVAKKGKFDLVLQGQAAVYAKPEFDLSEQVLEQVSKLK